MKKLIALLLALTMVFALCACGDGNKTPNEPTTDDGDTIYIGVYEPATGDNGAGGKQEALGIEYANYVTPTVEVGGKTYNVKLVSVDNESSVDKAPSAANTLVSSNVSVVLGSYGSSVAIAGGEVFAKAEIPAIGVTCTNPQVTEGNDYYYRICFLDPFQGTVLANHAYKDLGAKTAYCLAKQGDDYSGGLCNYFIKAFEDLGGKVVTYEKFPDGNSDFSSYVTKAKNANADIIFAPVSTEAAALIIEQADTQGIEMPILASDTWDSNVILNAAKGTKLKIDVTTFFIEGSKEKQVTDFVDGFKAWLEANSDKLANNGGNTELAAVTAMGFDAYYVALEAIKKAGSTAPADIQKVLADTTYTGVCGDVKFGANGDAERDVAYVKTVNTETGAWEFVTIAKVG